MSSKYANITVEHCYQYLRSLHLDSVCGVRGNPWQTLIGCVAKHKAGVTQGYAYHGGDILCTPDGYQYLSPLVARIGEQFEECQMNDFDAYDCDENGLTVRVYKQLKCGKWFDEYCITDNRKIYSPDVSNRYSKKPRKSVISG